MLISFEGIDGCGKSTQIELLMERFKDAGASYAYFREPGGTKLSEEVRSLLLDSDLEIDPFAELLLFSAARSQLVQEAILPALKRGKIVICDRFFDSTTAYQAAGRGIVSVDWAREFHLKVTDGLEPDLTFLLDIEPEVARKRIDDRDKDRMESAEDDFFGRVRRCYLQLSELEDRIVVLDAERKIEDLHDSIWEITQNRISAKE